MKTQEKRNLIVALAVLIQVAAVMGANDFQDSAQKNRSTYLGISDEYLTGSPSISRDRLVAAYDMETLTRDEKLKDFSGNNNHGTIHQTIYGALVFSMRRTPAILDSNHIKASERIRSSSSREI